LVDGVATSLRVEDRACTPAARGRLNRVLDSLLAERVRRFAKQPTQLRDRHRFGLMQLQILLNELGERGRSTAARTDLENRSRNQSA